MHILKKILGYVGTARRCCTNILFKVNAPSSIRK